MSGEICMKMMLAATFGVAVLISFAFSQYTSATPPSTFRGCLQGDAGGSGTPGVDTASYYANGTLSARSIRELEGICAVRFAPDRDEPRK